MSGAITVQPSKRFADDDEDLTLADLNDAGSPIMRVDPHQVGTVELIAEDVLAIISESLLGLRLDYTFPSAVSVPNTGLNLELVPGIDFPEALTGDPIYVTQLIGVNVDLQAVAHDGTVSIWGYGLGGGIIPGGAVVTIILFTSRRFLPPSAPGGGGSGSESVSSEDSGQVTVTEGYVWNPAGEPITTGKLDLTCQPTAALQADSIGRRELRAIDVQDLAAPVVNGLGFILTVPVNITLPPHNFAAVAVTVTGAAVGQVPVMHGGTIRWAGKVTAANTLTFVIQNLTNLVQVVPLGTQIKGRLI